MAHVVENRREEQQFLNAHEARAAAGQGAAGGGGPANRHSDI